MILPRIPLFRPEYGPSEMAELAAVMQSAWSGMGKRVDAFEHQFARECGAKHAVAVNSCTAALELAFRWMASRGLYRAVVPAITFCSTAQAALSVGMAVTFADVEARNLVRWIPHVEEPGTAQAIVHYGGQAWTQDGYNVIHDAAHCSPLEFKQPPHGIVCWSFEAKKVISCGDGGMITTNDDAQAEAFRRWRWCGISRSTWERSQQRQYQWDYDIPENGRKCHMNDITAAIGLAQMAKLDAMQLARRSRYNQYATSFIGRVPFIYHDAKSAASLFVVRVKNRDALSDELLRQGITTGVHYKPLYRHRALMHCQREPMPNTEALAPEILSLPMYPSLTEEECAFVVNRVLRYAQV